MEIKEFIETLKKSDFLLTLEKEKLVLKGNRNKLSNHEIEATKTNKNIINYIKEHKNELIEYLSLLPENLHAEKKVKDISAIYFLSSLQEGMLFHGLYDGGGEAYIEQFCCDLIAPDLLVFRQSWEHILNQHSILRSAFYHDQLKEPVQCVFREVQLPVEILDYRGMNEVQQAAAIRQYEEVNRRRGFDFKVAPLMRIALLRLSEDRYRMLWTSHHILFDGWSMQVLIGEFLNTYDLLLAGKKVVTEEEDRYEDYIRFLERRDKEQEEKYWRHYLLGVEQGTLLPFIGKTAERNKGAGTYKSISLLLDVGTTQKIESYVQHHRMTVNTLMQGVWSYLLHRYTGSKDIIYGVIVSGRPDDLPGVEHRVGMYINTLPLLSRMQLEESIVKWLQQIQNDQVSSRQYQHTPLNALQGWMGVQGDLFDSLLVYENYPVSKVLVSKNWSLEIENVNIDEQSNYPLTIVISGAEQMNIRFSYNSRLLEELYVNEIRDHFEHVLLQIIDKAEGRLADIDLLSPAEKHQLLYELNATVVSFPRDRTIVDIFEEQVLKTPGNIALVFEGEQLSYLELNQRANQLAHYLRAKGVKEETLVPICIERSLEMIIGILGILKAGGAYVPIDPGYPIERISYMLKDISCTLVVTTSDYLELFDNETQHAELVRMDDIHDLLSALSTDKVNNASGADSLAYVIYTSGSTGTPKGVMVTHMNVVSLVKGVSYVSLSSRDILLSTGSLSFDATTFEYWGMLLNGGQLILCTENRLLDSELLKQEIGSRGVNKMWFTSSWFNQLVETDISVFEGLETILVGGEKLSEQHIKRIRQTYPLLEIINGYGPTENTTFSLTHKITGIETNRSIPIGRPLSNRNVYVLDERQQLVPIGVSGEICLGGAGLARGYLNRPDLTVEKFIVNGFEQAEVRIYKTGDLGRWLPEGNIEYLGRMDEQVKIRGYRIELGEIESVLLQSGLVSQAVIVASEDKGTRRLMGYIVADEFDKEAITSYLRTRLPEYMVPDLWMELQSLPLTSNGKIDKKALPDLNPSALISNEYIAPRTEVETKLAEIWQELLDVERVGIHDNFFELGGDSLLAIRLISAIRKKLSVEMPISDIFEYPTIASLAGQLPGQSETTILSPIEVVKTRPERIPLSFSQERLWFIDHLEGSVQYHIPAVLRLKGKLNKDAFSSALRNIVNRHEILRTVIRQQEGEGWQYIKDKDGWQLNFIDGYELQQDPRVLQGRIERLISKPFDLSEDDMLRADLIILNNEEHVLVVTMHHIASDAWSLSILVKEFIEFYKDYNENCPNRLEPLKIQYADYAIWQRQHLQGEVLDRKLSYWKQKLQGVAPLQLLTDYPRPAMRSRRGAISEFSISKQVSEQLLTLSQQQGTTLFMTLMAVFKILLHRYSGQADVCVGTSIAGRQQQETEGLIGFFVNMLALRSEVSLHVSFIDLLQQVKATTLEGYENQEVPFEKVVDAVVMERNMSRNPLFQVLFVLRNTPEVPELSLGELSLSGEGYDHTTAQFDLTFNLTEAPFGLQGLVEYSTDLYREQTIGRMISHFKELLNSVVTSPKQGIGLLPMLTKAEQHLLLIEFNDTAVKYPRDRTIVDIFEEQVLKTPDNIALVFEEEQLSYLELNQRANQLAHYLRAKGIKEETLVPICIERSLEMIIGILGILKAGGAYVPIDPGYPIERISYMLKDISCTLVVTTSDYLELFDNETQHAELVRMDNIDDLLSALSTDKVNNASGADSLAYVIYTSGSTGTPKGVMVTHMNVVSLVKGVSYVSLSSRDILLSTGSLSFDATTFEYWGMLLNGGQLILCTENRLLDSELLKQEIGSRGVNKMWFTSSWFNQLVETDISVFEGLETILVGGEKLSEQHIKRIRQTYPLLEIINGYGPTENTTFSLTHKITGIETNRSIPIGRPLSNRSVYVLDERQQLCPLGVAGELYIGGDGLSRGYLNRAELTLEKFIQDPFSKAGQTRLYRSGDIGRWLPDGNIEYLGRKDDQVKIRGYRIELGEIESVLLQSELVSQAVVLGREDKEGTRRLVCYVVSEGKFDREAITSYLKVRLPEYMVPVLWVELESMPLTPNGKVDRKSLPDPDVGALLSREYVGARNEVESKLAEIWQELLCVERVGIHDNFFEIGGDSLLAIRLISAIRRELVVEMAISKIFEYSTIALLAGQLESQSGRAVLASIKSEGRPEHVPLSFSQERLWFIDRLGGSVQYHIPAVLRLKGNLNKDALIYSLRDMVNRHEVLRTVILEQEGEAYQHIKDKDGWELGMVDGHVYQQATGSLHEYVQQLINKPFDLSSDYMLRGHLITVDDQDHVLVITMHHIASDGWSRSVLVKEVIELYESYEENRPARLAPLEIQYADYSIWQRKHLQGELLDRKLGYWKEQLQGVPPLQLPTDYGRPGVRSTRGAIAVFSVDKELSEQLQLMSQQAEATLFMTLLAAFKVLLYRYSGQGDICVGTSVAGRQQQETESLIGFFINTLALRSHVDGELSFRDLLQQIRTTTLEAYEHQEVPFEKVVDAVVMERDMSRNPLFQVLFVLQNTPEIPRLRLGEMQLSAKVYEHTTAQFDLNCSITETAVGLQGSLEYSTDLYREQTITRMLGHFKELLSSIVKEPEQKIGKLPMLTQAEEHQLLREFNDTLVEYKNDKTVIDLFEEQAEKTPDTIALIFEEDQLRYEELNQRANQLAHYLRSRGVREETLVPICMEPGIEMVVGILGILKSGGAYVPVDPDYPLDRIRYMLEDSGAAIVVSSTASITKLPDSGDIDIIALDDQSPVLSQQPSGNLNTHPGSHHLAYVIYTSGSTGTPKGVMIEHRSLINYLLNSKARYIRDERDGVGSFIHLSYTFDASLTAMLMPLLWGKSIVVGSKGSVDVFEDPNFARYAPYDFIKITPSHLELLQAKIQAGDGRYLTRRLVVGGEALQPGHFNYFIDKGLDVEIINEYGPTEATVGCSTYRFYSLDGSEKRKYGIPIGKPIDNIQIYILNEQSELLPVGVVGELCIGGAGVARGYFNGGALTSEKFIVNRFHEEAGARMYRTGDLGRWLPDGNMEYLGRKDEQVKIRGYRIELGEIEIVLGQSELVRESVVVARENKEGTRQLVGYVVAKGMFDKEAIVSYLKSKLPEYMVPSVWVELESLPLTPHGKIDRKALPDGDASELLSNEYVAPRNELEVKLAEIWQELLGAEAVGIHDNFFELGGHSLLAIRLISLIRKELAVEMAISDIFDYPTIALLIGQIEVQSGAIILPPIKVEPRGEHIPLSFSQERLWFIDQLEGSVQYHVPSVLRLKGRLNQDALQYAFQTIVNRHEVLRTVILQNDGQPFQSIKNIDGWQLTIVNDKRYNQDAEALSFYVQKLINEPFDLSSDDMLRATLITLDDMEHVLVVTMHHIASDAWSTPIIVGEVVALYEAYVENRPVQLAPLEIQYADYAIWQRRYLQGEVLNKKLEYWKEKLQGVAPLQLPSDYGRPAIQSMKGAIAGFRIDKELSEQLQLLSQQEGATLFMTLMAAFKVLLYRYSGQQDICIGTPIAGRQQQEVEGLIGFFINTLALRSEVRGDISFTSLLQQMRATMLEAYEHHEVPFEKVVDAVVTERDMSRNPLFQVVFLLLNTPEIPQLRLGEVQLFGQGFAHNTSKFDLAFGIKESALGLEGSVEYCTDLYSEQTIRRMIDHYKELLSSIVREPQQRIDELPMLSRVEQHQLVVEFNDTTVQYPKDKTIVDLFEEQVAKTPNNIAVVFEDQQLTYEVINERSNQLGHYLRSRGVKAETLVPICIERSIEMIVGILGILKAGGAYVPIDPQYPPERINYMLKDTGASVVVSSQESRLKFELEAEVEVIKLDRDWSLLDGQSSSNLPTTVHAHHLAYAIYTSASTGKPKGVMVEHRSVVSLVRGIDYVSLTKEDILLSTGSPSFDATIFEYWGMLLNGGQLVLCSENRLLNNELLKEQIRSRNVNKMWFTSSWFNQLVDTDISVFEGLETLLVGGEKLSEQHIKKMRQTHPSIAIINGYGPTENTTFSLSYKITETEISKSIPVGRPISNRSAYIVDQRGGLVPIGVAGEICIGGAGLARGYLNNEELTNNKFVSSPFSMDEGARMYKTGDLGYWLPDGNIEYVGRVDDQVKIRGYRIELGEVQSVLGQSPGVRQCVVVAKEDHQGNKRLVAYVVPAEFFHREAAISYLKGKLPEYMVPNLWVELKNLPLTPNGKIDRKALPDLDATELLSNEYVAPRNEAEEKLVAIWQELLGVKRVGIQDNFFELGGDSIISIQLVNRAKRLGYALQPKDLFLHQTIGKLSRVIAERSDTGVVAEQGLLTGTSKLLPIQQWYFEREQPAISHFNQTILLAIDKTVTEAELRQAVEHIAIQHDALRFKYYQIEGRWQQEYGSAKAVVIREDLHPKPPDLLSSLISELSDKYQRSLDIEKGEILRVVWMQTPQTETANRLLIVIHHLAVDGVSWRILLEELERLLTGLKNHEKIDLGYKSTSYRQWYETLEKYGQTAGLLSQRSYWHQTANSYQPLAVDKEYSGEVREKEIGWFVVTLGATQTQRLLQEVPRVYHTEINDILLTALAITLCKWSNTDKIIVGLEGHGREDIAEGIDTSRTVGWFTSHFPVVLQVHKERGEDELIKTVKGQLRSIPDKGLGYGVLKYINKEQALQGKEPWDIIFNYLGQLDNIVKENKWLTGAREATGASISEEQVVNEKLSVNSLVKAGKLVLSWRYSTKHYEEQTVRNLAANYLSNLDSLTAHCLEQGKYGVVYPSPVGENLVGDFQKQEKKILSTIDSKCLVSARIGGSKLPLYIVCGGGGTVFKFKEFIEMLDANQPVYVLQQPTDIKDVEEFPVDIEGIAARYVKEIMAQNPNGPYLLSGHCDGGIAAFEMAKQMEAMGKKVKLLAVYDTTAPEKKIRQPRTFKNFYHIPGMIIKAMSKVYLKVHFETYLLRKHSKNAIQYKINTIKSVINKIYPIKQENIEFDVFTKLSETFEKAARNYQITPYNGDIIVFYAKDHYYFLDKDKNINYKKFYLDDNVKNRWKKYVKSATIYEVDGEHSTMFDPSNGKEFAKLLQQQINKCTDE